MQKNWLLLYKNDIPLDCLFYMIFIQQSTVYERYVKYHGMYPYVNAVNDGCLAMSEGTADMISRVQGRNQFHNFHNGGQMLYH